jgi:hypothetical protein
MNHIHVIATPTPSLNFTTLKETLEAKGFTQLVIPRRDSFLRVGPRPWWGYAWPFYTRKVEVVIVGHLVWFYEKKEVGWNSKLEFKTWGSDQKSIDDLLETL